MRAADLALLAATAALMAPIAPGERLEKDDLGSRKDRELYCACALAVTAECSDPCPQHSTCQDLFVNGTEHQSCACDLGYIDSCEPICDNGPICVRECALIDLHRRRRVVHG